MYVISLIVKNEFGVMQRVMGEFTRNKINVETIVVGEPKQPNGQPSENLPRVRAFVAQLKKMMPTMPVEYYDERFTSVLAHKAMIDGGLKKKARQNKALVDEISATIILQDYMNSKRFS